uniref:Uncharacterized protein n=1 Tax=Lactuca sativa TaxID=4236 RepID=A0A9R1W7R4_LACSA|nr:hypothetical protein LSAT_V11C300142040 [Lactuca sativa]
MIESTYLLYKKHIIESPLLSEDSLSRPHHVFKETYNCLSDDVVHVRVKGTFTQKNVPTLIDIINKLFHYFLMFSGLKLKSEAIYHLTLLYIEKSLLSCGLSLKQIPNMSLPDHKYIQDSCNMLIQYELNYDPSSLESEHQQLHSKLNVEQKKCL